MSSPGKTEPGRRRRRHERGSIFLDALFALLVGTLALTVALSGLALAARAAGRRWQQVIALVGERNSASASRPVVFGVDQR